MYYKAEANDDVLYLEADDIESAKLHLVRLRNTFDPEDFTWTELDELPEGQIPMTFEDDVERVSGNL